MQASDSEFHCYNKLDDDDARGSVECAEGNPWDDEYLGLEETNFEVREYNVILGNGSLSLYFLNGCRARQR